VLRKVFQSTVRLSPSPEASIYLLMGISYSDQSWCKWHMHSTAETSQQGQSSDPTSTQTLAG